MHRDRQSGRQSNRTEPNNAFGVGESPHEKKKTGAARMVDLQLSIYNICGRLLLCKTIRAVSGADVRRCRVKEDNVVEQIRADQSHSHA